MYHASGMIEGSVVASGGVHESPRQRGANDGGDALEKQKEPESVGQLFQAQEVDDDDGTKRGETGWK